MNITTFNPMIVTNRPEEVLKYFEMFGFTKKHAPTMKMASGEKFTDYQWTNRRIYGSPFNLFSTQRQETAS